MIIFSFLRLLNYYDDDSFGDSASSFMLTYLMVLVSSVVSSAIGLLLYKKGGMIASFVLAIISGFILGVCIFNMLFLHTMNYILLIFIVGSSMVTMTMFVFKH
jgi:hypothetical protein